MKHQLLIFILLIGLTVQCQTGITAKLKFETEEWDFGNIVQNVHVSHKFWLKNEGIEPAVIISVVGTGGGQVPQSWTRTPIASGDSGFVEILYGAFNLGYFTKIVSVQTNVGSFDLTIKGYVFEADSLAIHFDKTIHDFGKLSYTNELSCQFILQNTGNYPFSIYRINSSSGNMMFSWPANSIPAGDSVIITAIMLINTPGAFNKTGAVYINGVTKPYILNIKGEILPVAIESLPPSPK